MSTVQPTPQPAFAGRRTRQNLRCAARGKMQAQRTYLDCACRLEEQSLHVIAHAFRFTAAQEKEHAAVLNGLLALHREAVPGDDAPPLPLPPEPAGMLIAAAKYEHEGWDSFYPQCADTAREDGYPRIAAVFRKARFSGIRPASPGSVCPAVRFIPAARRRSSAPPAAGIRGILSAAATIRSPWRGNSPSFFLHYGQICAILEST